MISFNFGRSKLDPEKSILPTIILIDTDHESFGDLRRSGFRIVFGWWDFYFSILYVK